VTPDREDPTDRSWLGSYDRKAANAGAARHGGLCRPAFATYPSSAPETMYPAASITVVHHPWPALDPQHEAVGSRYGTSVVPGGGNPRPHPRAAVISLRAGGHLSLALLQLGLSSPQWSLVAPGGGSPTLLIALVGFDLNSATVLLDAVGLHRGRPIEMLSRRCRACTLRPKPACFK
jgi:hypothetical protein